MQVWQADVIERMECYLLSSERLGNFQNAFPLDPTSNDKLRFDCYSDYH